MWHWVLASLRVRPIQYLGHIFNEIKHFLKCYKDIWFQPFPNYTESEILTHHVFIDHILKSVWWTLGSCQTYMWIILLCGNPCYSLHGQLSRSILSRADPLNKQSLLNKQLYSMSQFSMPSITVTSSFLCKLFLQPKSPRTWWTQVDSSPWQ